MWCITLSLASPISKDQLSAVDSLVKMLELSIGMPISVSTDDCTISLAVGWDQTTLGSSKVIPVSVEEKLKENNVQQSLEFSMDFAASISDFMKQYKCDDEDDLDDYSDEEDLDS